MSGRNGARDPAEWAFYGAFRGTAHRDGDCFRCWESWSLGVKERERSVNDRRSDASRIRHGETGRLAAPWGRGIVTTYSYDDNGSLERLKEGR